MAVSEVVIVDSALLPLFVHAFITDREEVIGVLFGHVDKNADGTTTAWVLGSMVIPTGDQQSDRVEIFAERLCEATEEAEKMSVKYSQPLRVVGWYHSHPRITHYPSHVDLKTQGTASELLPERLGGPHPVGISC